MKVTTCEECGCPDWFHSWAPCVGQWWAWRDRLSPRFVEWMQGLPDGWVTDILPCNPALKALGNGVVPQQAALALRLLGVTATGERAA